ncbi:hypothetical protein Ahy_B04g072940 [Arachis hypogaea]|uniref:Uncharacterized protein n=1 Tax=Arachis hypogaea TaxID=3818 RepID=A0A444ZP73_ARAHY|nr:hypothetical protein Ahy_B04g072940 [Arachis hypogaea]
MEVSGAVLRNFTCPSFSMHVSSHRRGGGGCVMVLVRMREKAVVHVVAVLWGRQEGAGNHYVECQEKAQDDEKTYLPPEFFMHGIVDEKTDAMINDIFAHRKPARAGYATLAIGTEWIFRPKQEVISPSLSGIQ